MAQRTLNEFQNKPSNGGYNGPTFFNLKNDGDSAIVRFMHPTPDSITVYDTHKVVTPKFKFGRTVACLRDPREPLDNCPLCKAGHKTSQKIFVRLIEYVRQEDGTIKPEPKIWEKPMGFAWELTGKMKMYGPLDKVIFIITRHTPDPANKQNTTYSIDYAPSEMYPQTTYPNKPELFENFDVVGHGLYAPSYEDMEYYLINNDFPAKVAPTETNNVQQQFTKPVQQVNEQAQPQQSISQAAPWEDTPFNSPQARNEVPSTADGQPQRPVRYY